jgi:hypothetical protein
LNKILLFVFIILFFPCCRSGSPVSEPPGSQLSANENKTSVSDSLSTSSVLPDSVGKWLTGKWMRNDGVYTIEVFSVTKDGRMDAGYFNPNPIHVDKAEWKITEGRLYMRVILKDINYPGSTYVLVYDRVKDNLSGNYFQAVDKMNYDVFFVRKK